MIRLGEKQELVIVKKVEFGVYLAVSFEEAAEHVLLPVKQVPEDSEVGDKLEVFVYRDSKDRIIATVNEPLLCMGKVAELTVVTVGRFGAFLDWGLEKDLLLPFREQRGVVKEQPPMCHHERLCVTSDGQFLSGRGQGAWQSV